MFKSGGSKSPLDADPGWRTLTLMNDWIKHADAKAGITVAATGTAGILLFNLTSAIPASACWYFYAPSLVAAVLLFATAYCCARALVPRTDANDSVVSSSTLQQKNPLFYGDISSNWEREPYVRLIVKLAASHKELLAHLGAQIHVNADIVSTKLLWTNRAIRLLAAASTAIALTAIAVLLT